MSCFVAPKRFDKTTFVGHTSNHELVLVRPRVYVRAPASCCWSRIPRMYPNRMYVRALVFRAVSSLVSNLHVGLGKILVLYVPPRTNSIKAISTQGGVREQPCCYHRPCAGPCVIKFPTLRPRDEPNNTTQVFLDSR